MTQAENRRTPRASRPRKIMVLASMVLILCLACFALGILVGGSGSEVPDEAGRFQSDMPAGVRINSSAEDEKIQALGEGTKKVMVQPRGDVAAVHQNVVKEIGHKTAETEGTVNAVLAEKPDVRGTPLGSGINLRDESRLDTGSGANESVPAVDEAAASVALASSNKTPEKKVEKAAGAKPADTAKETSLAPAASDIEAKKGGYVVQVAAFRSDADAQRLAQRLKTDFPVHVRRANLADKGQWFRVLVGPVAKRGEADMLKQHLKVQAGIEGFVKRYP